MSGGGFKKRARMNQLLYQNTKLSEMVIAQEKIISEYRDVTAQLLVLCETPTGNNLPVLPTDYLQEEE